MSDKVKILIDKSDLVGMADVVRSVISSTDKLNIDELLTGVRENVRGGSVSTATEDGLVTRNLTSYTNDRVATIGSSAFCYHSKLTTVSFPACTTIGSFAFYCCFSLTSVSFPACTTIGNAAFYNCSKLTTASFPACTTIGDAAFSRGYSLTSVSFPVCTTIDDEAFYFCSKLTTVSFPACTTIGSSAFYSCSKLTTASFPACTTIGNAAFSRCYELTSLYLMGSSLCGLSSSGAFYSTPIGGYSVKVGTYGSIFVPASLLTAYKSATNWAYFSNRFVGV